MSIRLTQGELHSLFLKDLGNYATNVEDKGFKPLKMYLKYPFNRKVDAYIFNCTAPPGGRSADEWKIQLILRNQKRGQRGNFDDSDGSTILIIGYACLFDDKSSGLWVLFELDKHKEFAYSANIQIYSRQLLKALESGMYVYKKQNDEIVVISEREDLARALEKRFTIDRNIMLEKAEHEIK